MASATEKLKFYSRRPSSAPSSDAGEERFFNLAERKTAELVIGMVAPVGSGATTTASILSKKLNEDYGYEVDYIKLSKIMQTYSGTATVDAGDPGRVEKLQAIGNQLREKFGNHVLSSIAVDRIYKSREGDDTPRDRRLCTIVDSLKHPEEVELLREVYGDSFWLMGVFAPEKIRIERVESSLGSSSYVEKIKSADFDEGLEHGQSVRKTMSGADVFIRNDQPNEEKLSTSIDRFLRLIFGISVETPSKDEVAMHGAAGAALGSACLSRQVGAVIISATGEVIGRGANDVPRFGGGTYNSDDSSGDHRCFKWKNKICWNDKHKIGIIEQISKGLGSSVNTENVKENIKRSGVQSLIEFSRAVHAEMEAIISVARQGNGGIVGSSLYTTTFPCHSCARHIVASGIDKVLYIEPYPKSLALTLHSDSITMSESEGGKVKFLQYEGVAPGSFNRVFGMFGDRKANGSAIAKNRKEARPVAAPALDSLVSREQIVLANAISESEVVNDDARREASRTIPNVSSPSNSNKEGSKDLF
ncbi:anti-phage dCTP deaminase [Aureimonas pseudogalii]|uniref:Deoxycytidylate deaminase n=1 Tax=Aureimonas pseudogalii TaxID=1744844 RepID=A0A7W6ECY4_9HYPH|nr:anti-phage dCTP deaminase [Aureimonas pseudogalii]MBB3996345.1 deoxycytidylate deaminase [Aureimonas pseudogalii]